MVTYTIRINDSVTLGKGFLGYLKTLCETNYVEIVKPRTRKPRTYKMLPPITLTDEEMQRIEDAEKSGIHTDIESLKSYLESQL